MAELLPYPYMKIDVDKFPNLNYYCIGKGPNMKRYEQLGQTLQTLRKDQGTTLAQVANSVGIDNTHLSKLENGHERPSEEVFLKLIGHFSISRDQAVKLWHQAGYADAGLVLNEKGERSSETMGKVEDNTPKQVDNIAGAVNMNVNINREKVPILFADAVYVLSNETGLVLDFAQGIGPTPQQHVVCSVGMSKEQAKRVIQAMKDNLGIE